MKGDYLRDTRLGRMWIFGAVLLVLSTLLFVLSDSPAATSAVIGILLGAVLVVPVLLRPVAVARPTHEQDRAWRRRHRCVAPREGAQPIRIHARAGDGRDGDAVRHRWSLPSFRAGLDKIVDRQFGADLFVNPQAPDDGSLQAKLIADRNVARVTPIRFGIATAFDKDHKREELFILIIDPNTYFS